MFREIAILGPGLLGGSIALALQGRARIRMWGRREAVVEKIRHEQMADLATNDPVEAVQGADLVILCTPVEAMAGLVQIIAPHLTSGCLITDVGSVKEKVVREVSELVPGHSHFIGSHPMAGSEQAGWEAARRDLFTGAACILTPEAGSDGEMCGRLAGFWESLGCHVLLMTAREHDQQVARVSHLPHLAAAALMRAAGQGNLAVAGGGLRDSTRIASGPPEMWTGILQANQNEVRAALRGLIQELEHADSLLEQGDAEGLRKFLTGAKTLRHALAERKNHGGN